MVRTPGVFAGAKVGVAVRVGVAVGTGVAVRVSVAVGTGVAVRAGVAVGIGLTVGADVAVALEAAVGASVEMVAVVAMVAPLFVGTAVGDGAQADTKTMGAKPHKHRNQAAAELPNGTPLGKRS
jgi:UDP-3-O-[3-hydroxymyristoyl] glucosamine N-acyltransferase